MKTLRLVFVLSVVAIGIAACGTTAKNTLPGYNWKVTYFGSPAQGDLTAQFTGYEFFFNTNGQLIAKKGDFTTIGEWYIGDNNGERVVIIIDGDSNLDKLADDWWTHSTDVSTVQMDNRETDLTSITLKKI